MHTEKTYMELAGLYNWCVISCADTGSENERLRSIEEINQEILKIVTK